MNAPWNTFLHTLHDAVVAFVRGNPAPYQALWAHADDVSICGAFGGYERGWQQIDPRLAWASAQYRDGDFQVLDIIAQSVGADIAYRVHTERIRSHAIDTDTEVVRERRVTHIFRYEPDGWRIIHQHSDPLLAKQTRP